MARKCAACLLSSLLLAFTGDLAAQTVRTGSITGTATDESGAAVAGVSVIVTSPAS
jgi:hypothetical protein